MLSPQPSFLEDRFHSAAEELGTSRLLHIPHHQAEHGHITHHHSRGKRRDSRVIFPFSWFTCSCSSASVLTLPQCHSTPFSRPCIERPMNIAGRMVQWVQEPAAQPDGLNWIAMTHMIGDNLTSCSLTSHQPLPPYTPNTYYN